MNKFKSFFLKVGHYLACAALVILGFFISFYIFLYIPAFFVIENGEKAPTPLLFILPIAIAGFIGFASDRLLNKTSFLYNPSFFEAKAKDYLKEISIHYLNAQTAETIRQFLAEWIVAENCTVQLDSLSDKLLEAQAHSLLWAKSAMNEFQWKFCDAIDRSTDNALSDINSYYRNNKKQRADIFFEDMRYGLHMLSGDSLESASRALQKISAKAGVAIPEDLRYITNNSVQYSDDKPGDSLMLIDTMSGEQFELWCADLLTRLGFQDVSLTKTSGDQGVDLLAHKDGIKYAIQCKCYSSDLGNTPVQEVNAGKVIYGCHIGAVLTNRYFTSGGTEAAAATGVLLWDRGWIQNKLSLLDTDGRC